MDTSLEYIKQCEKAEEIQNTSKALVLDDRSIHIDSLGSWWAQKYIGSTNWAIIWLPRQDQLQEMLKPKNLTPFIGALYKWLKDNNYDQYFDNVTSNPFFSMEQIWLAFVMFELYQKTWNGSEWIKV